MDELNAQANTELDKLNQSIAELQGIHIFMYVCICIYACIYACMYVCVYVCMYVYIYVCIYEPVWRFTADSKRNYQATKILSVKLKEKSKF